MNKLAKNERLYYYLQYQLKLRGIGIAQIAKDLGVSVGHVQRAMWGERESPAVRAKLHRLLGRDVLDTDFDDYPKDIEPSPGDLPAEASDTEPESNKNGQ